MNAYFLTPFVIMTSFDFFSSLDKLLAFRAALGVQDEVRYLLIDGHTGQVETRRLFRQYQEVLEYIEEHELEEYQIATVILER